MHHYSPCHPQREKGQGSSESVLLRLKYWFAPFQLTTCLLADIPIDWFCQTVTLGEVCEKKGSAHFQTNPSSRTTTPAGDQSPDDDGDAICREWTKANSALPFSNNCTPPFPSFSLSSLY
ncbi:hypothetical protein ACH3XW_27140 [Acanthocheilonema viteae]